MNFYSPLRYPGGKNKLAKFVAMICECNNINGHYIEPYAGGASVALYLLLQGKVKEISINDFDRSIYAFWFSVLNNTEKFCKRINETKVNIENWRKYKKIQQDKHNADVFELGFSTFFLNRTNRSGIIDGGMIGGVEQNGNYNIDCRFNKSELIERIKFIAIHKSKIHLYNLDAIELIKLVKKTVKKSGTIFYFDPPYYLKGPSLYMNHYKHSDHLKVSEEIRKIKNIKWIVSYDNTPEIRKLYKDNRRKEYSFVHTAYKAREGKELLFFSEGLIVPRIAQPTKMQ